MKRVLVAEDEEHIAKLITFKLAKEGFDVICARDGQEALNLLAKDSCALVILDLMMPVMDGSEALKRIRSDGAYAATPVLILSAKGGQKEETAVLALGANRFLRKPFDPSELARVVKEMTA